MAEIFISYARPDRDYARRLASYLENAGLSVWWDMNLEPGQVFREEIERRIGEARHVIVLWSEASVKSHFVLDEAGDAARQNKLVPMRIDGCKLPYGFGQHHTHTVSNWLGDLAPLLAAVSGSDQTTNPVSAKTAEDFFNKGEAAFNAGEYDRTISDFSEAISLNSNYASAYTNRAIAYARKHDLDHAIADCSELIRLNPNDAAAYHFRGAAYFRQGDYDRAIADCNEEIRLNPDEASAYKHRGDAYRQKRDYARAISDYDQVLLTNPNDKGAAANKALAEKELAKARKQRRF